MGAGSSKQRIPFQTDEGFTRESRKGQSSLTGWCTHQARNTHAQQERAVLPAGTLPQPRHRPPANVAAAESIGEVNLVHCCVRFALRLHNVLAGGSHAQHASA